MDASFYITKKTFYKPIILAISCVAMAAFYWYLIPHYGLMGAAWATLAGFLSYTALTALFAQRIYRIEYQLRRITSLLLLGCGLSVFGRFVSGTIPVIGLLARCALLIAFPTILWVSGFLTGGEKVAIVRYWQVLRLRFHHSTETT
jgi:O-antigen/teichoic acid export membrane protein